MLTAAAINAVGGADDHHIQKDRFFWRPVDDSIFVVDLNRLEFTVLNSSAALLWLSLLDQSTTPGALAAILSEAFERSPDSLSADVASATAEWIGRGWITPGATGGFTISSRATDQRPPPYRVVTRETLELAVSAARDEWHIDCNLIGEAVSIHFKCDPGLEGSDISRRASSFLDGIPRSKSASKSAILCHVTAGGIYLRLDDTCVHALDVSDGLSRLVLWAFYLGYGADNLLGTFHAAAVGRENGAILMPGISGRGKSTLTAFLVANGWLYGGDDIIGLGRPTADDPRCLVMPFCSALSVKKASLSLLAPLYPDLEDLPEISYDIKRARFLRIPQDKQMGAEPSPRRILSIVFPHFDKAAPPAEIMPLTTRDALLALAGVGYRTGEQMDARLLGGLLDFLEMTPKYRLNFSDPASADQVLRELS